MKKMYTFVLAMAASMSVAFGTTTYDFSTAIADGWTVNPAPQGFETTDLARGMQMAATTTLTLPNVQNVGSVVINGSSNIDNYTMEVKVGTTSFGTKTLPNEKNQTWTFSGTATSGDLTIIVTRATKKSVWIKTITIDGESSVPTDTTGTVTPGESELDTAYVYAEPTVVTNSDSIGSNIAYSFISNNVKVTASKGARTGTYFSANADNTMTFTTTRPMKGLVVNGFVKKGFEATTNAGTIVYESSDEEDVTAEEVLAITDINATSVTISCVKQMRCYSVSIYFEENPEVDIEPGDDDDDDVYSFEWEPTTPTQMTITFDSLQMQDLTENLGYACTDLYFVSEEYEAEITVFASLDEFGLLPLGAYPIDTTYAENTVQASPGGDEYYDYPSYVITDFEQDPESGDWYYNTAYYLASGTLYMDMTEGGQPVQYLIRLEATTHFGSTIQTEYRMYLPADGIEQTAAENTASKMLRNHELLIRKGGKTYTVMGVQVR